MSDLGGFKLPGAEGGAAGVDMNVTPVGCGISGERDLEEFTVI